MLDQILAVADRSNPHIALTLMKWVVGAAKSERIELHMVNLAAFVVPGRTELVASDLPDLTVITINTDGSYTYVHVMEASLRDAAVDFARALCASPYVATCEEAIAFLEELVAKES